MLADAPSLIQVLLGAVTHHEAGRLAAAEVGYASVLAADPEQPQALFFGGTLALKVGRTEQAVQLLQRSVLARPDHVESRFALGNALWTLGDKEQAVTLWHAALQRDGRHLGSLLNLARACEERRDADGAIDLCRLAAAAAPSRATPHAAMASALRAAGRLEEALDEADLAVAHAPDLPQAHFQRGTTLRALGRFTDALAALSQAVRLAPSDPAALLNLANTLHDLGDAEAAEHYCRAAIAADPAMAEAHAVLGLLLTESGQLAPAIDACAESVRLQPDLATAHWNMGIAMLLRGDLAQGFAKYEWRKRHPRYAGEFIRPPQPEWRGQDLAGKRLVVIAEQGLGDAIMFARYAAPLAAQGATVVLACDRRLLPLLQGARGVAEAVQKQAKLPPCDLWVDQMSLPLLCGTTLDRIPSPGPYLSADPARIVAWRSRLPPRPPALRRVGLVWAGNPLHSNDLARSAPAHALLPLVQLSGVEAYSLQVGHRAHEADLLGLEDLSPLLTDYAETAALIAQLDLVVTVDTSVAHLAASLGKPTWIMLPHAPDWRWGRDRSDSPWYGSVRLFRQPGPGDWASVTGEIVDAARAG